MNEDKKLRLPRLISDGMVLQRETKTNIWGWGKPSDSITLKFMENEYETFVDESGKWKIVMDNLEAGGPYEMEIREESGEKFIIKDILVGDVWICSGQSNMELPMRRVKDRFPEDIEQCENPNIRLYKVTEHYDFHEPIDELLTGQWKTACAANILDFSATSYFFQKSMVEANSVPIGIINVSLGGSPVEAWMGEEMLEDFSEYREIIATYKKEEFVKQQLENNEKNSYRWYKNIEAIDAGLKDKEKPWYIEDLDDNNWNKMELPAFFQDAGIRDFKGVIWFRKKVEVPKSMVGKDAKLWLGTIVDSDDTYLNGVKVGNTPYQYPPRKYEIPSHLLKEGENTIVVRVICNNGYGRFTPDKVYSLFTNEQSIDLKGSWKYKIAGECEPLQETNFVSWKPTGLYNGMLAPCHNYTIKGALWYQGESNTGAPDNYRELFSKMITSWRKKWNQEEFPFIYVQLPNFEIDLTQEGSGWPEIREAQRLTLELPNTGMVVGIDVGEENDLHPLNKKEIGYRLSLVARALALHEKVEYSGPVVDTMKVYDHKVILNFSHASSGLRTKNGGNPDNFQIAGPDKKFVAASAEIQGEQIIVWNKEIKNPSAISYAYMNNPKGELLYNKEMLPASPFRKDLC